MLVNKSLALIGACIRISLHVHNILLTTVKSGEALSGHFRSGVSRKFVGFRLKCCSIHSAPGYNVYNSGIVVSLYMLIPEF